MLWSQFPGLIFQLFYILTVWRWTSYLTSLYLSFLTIKCKLKIVPTIYIGEGHGNPLQYSRLENSMDSGAWWATVHGVTKGRTWLTHTHQSYKVFMRLTGFPDGYGLCRWLSKEICLKRHWRCGLQYFCLENSTDRGARLALVQWVSKSWTRLSDQAHTLCW